MKTRCSVDSADRGQRGVSMKLILGMVRQDKMDDVRSALEKLNVRAGRSTHSTSP